MPSQTVEPRHSSLPSPRASDHHFGTDHLLTDLKSRTVSSGFVTTLAQGVQFALNLVSVVALARLLSPDDFGLVAMVTTITGFLRIFNDAGLSTATVQREGITHAQVSNLFWVNVGLGTAVMLLLAALSPLMAWFYQEPRLVGITLALCVTFLLASSAVQHLALLKRQMRFTAIAWIQVASMAAGVLAGIGMAWAKFGYWSLVGMQLVNSVATCLLTWFVSHWRPQFPRRASGTRALVNFGANLTASAFLYSLARGLDGLLIGRFYGPGPLGLYNRAGALVMRPVQQFVGPVESVFVPLLSRLQTRPERYRRVLLEIYDVIAVTSFLFTGLLLGLAHPLTIAVLGNKWEGAAPIFASFTLAALYMPIGSVASWLLTSQGRGKDFLLQASIGSALTVLSFLIGLPFGPKGIAASYSAFCLLIALPLTYHIAGRSGPVTTKDLWSHFLKHLPLWCVVCGATCLTRWLVPVSTAWKELMVCAPAGLLAGAAFICVYPPARRTALNFSQALRELKNGRNGER